ncbi:MAG: hypothetical protein B7733_05975 [Myxococcales bacterium FL481]|nr:MAG: hypothetical protein B7733_05975 [Myxococcales bacterium FL481]
MSDANLTPWMVFAPIDMIGRAVGALSVCVLRVSCELQSCREAGEPRLDATPLSVELLERWPELGSPSPEDLTAAKRRLADVGLIRCTKLGTVKRVLARSPGEGAQDGYLVPTSSPIGIMAQSRADSMRTDSLEKQNRKLTLENAKLMRTIAQLRAALDA